MEKHIRGLYETIITETLDSSLRDIENGYEISREQLNQAEAPDRFAMHLSRIIERAIASLPEDARVKVGAEITRHLVDEIVSATNTKDLLGERPVGLPKLMLHGIFERRPDGRPEQIERPLTPLMDTTLLTNSPDEPRVGHEIKAEIPSADRIDAVVAFIRYSGLLPLIDALRKHCQAGREFRVLTTIYTGSTEARALDELVKLGARVKVSYDTGGTRLHAKTWLFFRNSGMSTAYIGSSNLTHTAQVSGLEWNMRVSNARNPSVISKVAAVFESYWNSNDFVPYDRKEFEERSKSSDRSRLTSFIDSLELRPEPYQEALLEKIALARESGHHRNLLVSATGTGKTVMAAIDYARIRNNLPRARLLFVAHREEILNQARTKFAIALRDASFGELWVGDERPREFEHVFASIQTLNEHKLRHIKPDHFDMVIVDEFHHAAAKSYQALLAHLRPIELLGLTATPERADGLPVLDFFDGRIAAELRLWDAIDQHRLAPFHYFGLHDGLDLREVPWRRGRGYDVEGLSKLLTGNDIWAGLVIEQLRRHVNKTSEIRAIGFCVSVQHARFMERIFNENGIKATAIWSDTATDKRKAALKDLDDRRVNVIFSVDLFNEGVDVPSIDTLLMLRPTDSPTLFLQQLGRGLRKCHDKAACTVLDFVGLQNADFRFDRRFRALLRGSRSEIESQIKQSFPYLPAGCHMELDRKASEIVLENIRRAIPSQWNAKVEELRNCAIGNPGITFREFLQETGLETQDIYAGRKSWSDLSEAAGLPVLPRGPQETQLRVACGRLIHVNDLTRIDAYSRLASLPTPPDPCRLSPLESRYLRMLVCSVVDQVVDKDTDIQEGIAILWNHPQVLREICALMDTLKDNVAHVPQRLDGQPDVPLSIHACYSRIEILAAFGVGNGAKATAWREGVYWARDAGSDLLAFTLNKTTGGFSPTTRYRDYAINQDLIHWESQSTARAASPTGQRYQNHASMGTDIMLFARLHANDRAFYFLGPATYVKHESEMPMQITWRLTHRLPADLFTTFAAAVA